MANTTYSIKFEAIQSTIYVAGNQAPQFLIKPQDEYVRKVDNTNSAAKINPINIGSIYDLENDNIEVNLSCMNCLDPNNQSLFSYDSGKEAILIAQNITAGQYKMNMTLADDHSENPKS